MKRTRYTRKAREGLLAQFRSSGSRSPTAFAAEHGVKPTTFANWLTQARKRERDRSAPLLAESLRFVAVEAAPMATPAPSAAIELHVREISLRVPTTIGPAFVAELVALLAERHPC